MERIINAIMQSVYGQGIAGEPARLRVPVSTVLESIENAAVGEVEVAIQKLDVNGLVHLTLARDAIEPTPFGKIAFDEDCSAEVCLGTQHIQNKYRDAVVHVLVRNSDGDPGGATGFFCRDFPDWVVTAKHVLDEHELVAINSRTGEQILDANPKVRVIMSSTSDLALVQCLMPANIVPPRIAWNPQEVKDLDPVLVLGFPPLAGHFPALVSTIGRVSTIAAKMAKPPRQSLIISYALDEISAKHVCTEPIFDLYSQRPPG